METGQETAVTQVDSGALENLLKHLATPRSERQLGRLNLDDRAEFVRQQERALRSVVAAGAVFSINIGRALRASKATMAHGEFRAWAERQCGLKPSTITHYMKCARSADKAKLHNVSIEKLSSKALLRLDNLATKVEASKELKRQPHDERARSNRKAGEMNRLVLQLEWYVDDDPQLATEILLPACKAVIKKLSELRKRNMAVRESGKDSD